MTYDQAVARFAADPATSYWLKAAIAALANRDPVNAANDAQILADMANLRLTEALA